MFDLNPVFKQEVTRSMRRASHRKMFYACLLLVVLLFIFEFFAIPGLVHNTTHRVFTVIADTVLLYMLMLVLFFVPGIAATSIVGERERQTLAPLQISLLSPFNIVFGKALASLFFPMLLMLATLPLLAIALAFGSITLAVVYISKGLFILVLTAFGTASISLLCSAVMDSSQRAIFVSYSIVSLIVVMMLVTSVMANHFVHSNFAQVVRFNTWEPIWWTGDIAWLSISLNPLSALADATGELDPGRVNSIMSRGHSYSNVEVLSSTMNSTRNMLLSEDFQHAINKISRDNKLGTTPLQGSKPFWTVLPFWVTNVVATTLVSIVCLLIASLKLKTPSK